MRALSHAVLLLALVSCNEGSGTEATLNDSKTPQPIVGPTDLKGSKPIVGPSHVEGTKPIGPTD